MVYYLFLRFMRRLRPALDLRVRSLLARFFDHGFGGLLARGLHECFEAQVIDVVRGPDSIDHRLDTSVRGSTRIVTVPLS